jgi:type IV secretory pathway VirB10-like protein
MKDASAAKPGPAAAPGAVPSAIPSAVPSAVFASPKAHLPRVARRDPAWRLALGCLGVGCFGAVVFTNLSHGRLSAGQAEARVPTTPPTAPASPPPPAPAAAPPATPTAPNPAPGPPVDDAAAQGGPAVVLDLSDQRPAAPPADAQAARPPGAATAASTTATNPNATPEERFSDRLSSSSVQIARASRLRDTALIAPQGTVIPAVLETALNSDLPGFARAIVSSDVRGYDNSTVLIPKGSKLVGEYKSAVSPGQSRAFVVWTRLLTPEGVSIDLGSPGADELGRGGLAGETNTHFLRRFSSSILTSVITAGLAIAASGGGSSTAIILNSPTTTAGATAPLARDLDIPDTISVKQGAAIRVFVAKDLDFSTVMARAAP